MRHRNIGSKPNRILSQIDKLMEMAGNDMSVGVGKVKSKTVSEQWLKQPQEPFVIVLL